MMMLCLNSCVHNLMDKTKETYISYLLKQVSALADSRDTVDQEHYDLDLGLQDTLFLRVVSTSNICYFHFHVSLS